MNQTAMTVTHRRRQRPEDLLRRGLGLIRLRPMTDNKFRTVEQANPCFLFQDYTSL